MRDQLDVMTPAGGEGSYQNCVPAPHPSPSPDANNCGPLPVFGGFFTESWYINNKYVSLLQERGGQGDLSSFSSNIDICIRICHCKFMCICTGPTHLFCQNCSHGESRLQHWLLLLMSRIVSHFWSTKVSNREPIQKWQDALRGNSSAYSAM